MGFRKRAGAKGGGWVLDSRVNCRKAKHARTNLITTITGWPYGVQRGHLLANSIDLMKSQKVMSIIKSNARKKREGLMFKSQSETSRDSSSKNKFFKWPFRWEIDQSDKCMR